MASRSDLNERYDVATAMAPALHYSQAAPYEIAHIEYDSYMRPMHDVGGRPDVPVRYEEKEEEQWELDTYVTCEVLAWRGFWTAEERRRRGNNDVGQAIYLGFPYYGRWVWAAARMLVDKNHVSLTDLMAKIAEVKARHGKS